MPRAPARAARAAEAAGRTWRAARPAARRAAQHQELDLGRGHAVGNRQPVAPRRSRRARRDAGDAARAQAGAIVLGVTNVAEQLMAWETDNALYGRTNSPWDLGAHAGRFERRRVGRDRGGALRRRRRQRWRRLHPRPRPLHRHRRTEAHAGTRAGHRALPAMRRPVRAHRRRRPDGAHGGRCRAAAVGDGGTGHRRPERAPGAAGRARSGWRLGAGGWRIACPPPSRQATAHGRRPRPRARRLVRRRRAHAGGAGDPRGRATRRGCVVARGLRRRAVPARGPRRGARAVVGDLRPRLAPAAGAAVAGHEDEVHPNLPQFLEWTRQHAEAHRRAPARGRDRSATCCARGCSSRWKTSPCCSARSAPSRAFRHGERTWTIDGREVHYLDAWSYAAWFNLLQNPGGVGAGGVRRRRDCPSACRSSRGTGRR